MFNERIKQLCEYSHEEEGNQYSRPWIIGFSEGKDFIVLLTWVWLALFKIKEGAIIINKNFAENQKSVFNILQFVGKQLSLLYAERLYSGLGNTAIHRKK